MPTIYVDSAYIMRYLLLEKVGSANIKEDPDHGRIG